MRAHLQADPSHAPRGPVFGSLCAHAPAADGLTFVLVDRGRRRWRCACSARHSGRTRARGPCAHAQGRPGEAVNCALAHAESSRSAHADRCCRSPWAAAEAAHESPRVRVGPIERPRAFTRGLVCRAELGLHSTALDCCASSQRGGQPVRHREADTHQKEGGDGWASSSRTRTGWAKQRASQTRPHRIAPPHTSPATCARTGMVRNVGSQRARCARCTVASALELADEVVE